MPLRNAFENIALDSSLQAILTELGPKIEAADLAALSTAARQDAAKAVLDGILAAVDGLEAKDYATQTTLAAVLAELGQKLEPADLAALATAAKQDASKAVLDQIATAVGGRLDTHMPYHSDVFGGLVTGARDNQIEVHYDDVNWATYVTATASGGGSSSQHEGHVHFETGTGANGKSKAVTLDVIKYRPMHEIYSGWTAAFPVAGVANSYMRIGFADSAYLNGLVTGYEGTSFGLTWFRNGVATTVAQAAWDDPCDGSPGSAFTRDGVPEALNPAFTNIFRARVGLLGSAHLILEVYTPDGEWIPVHTFKRPNLSSEPTFTNFDLPMLADVSKTGAGATALEIRTACWAGGTTSQSARLSDTITDRSLAQTVRAVIEGKTPGGSYAKVTVNAQGRLQVTNDSVGTDGAAAPAGTTAVGGLGPGGLLQTIGVDASGNLAALPLPTGAATEVNQTTEITRLTEIRDKTGLTVTNAIASAAFNLQSAPFSGTSGMANDYVLDHIEFNFSTTQARDITVTSFDGTEIWKDVGNTSRNVVLEDIALALNAAENFTITVTQTAGACLMDVKATVTEGGAVLSGITPSIVNTRRWGSLYTLRAQRFIATTGYVSGPQNTSTPLALLRNPTGSGKWIFLDQAEFGSSLDSRFSRFGGGTSGSLGTPQPVGASDGSTGLTPVAEIYRGGSPGAQYAITSAGTLRKVATMRAYQAYQLLSIEGTAVLRPGQQTYWTMDEPAGGGAGTYEAFIDFEWVEIPEAQAAALVAAATALTGL